MAKKLTKADLQSLPVCAADFIKQVIKKMRYRKKVQADVAAELIAHFEDELKECSTEEQKEQKAQRLIAEFGDIKLLAVLLRRAKKRCRPLWRRYLVRSSQVISIIVLYIVIRVIFLAIGTPNISINYVDWLNDVVRASRPEKENAQSYYNKAIELYVECPSAIEQKRIYSSSTRWLADFNDLEMKCLSKWLIDNQLVFDMLKQGASKSYCWSTYSSDDTELVSSGVPQNIGKLAEGAYWQAVILQNVMKRQAPYRKLAHAMADKILYEANDGHINLALNDCIVLQKFGSHLQGKGLLIEQLVGIAIEALSHDRIFTILGKIDFTSDVLKDFHQKFVEHFVGRVEVINLEAEKAFWYDLVQRGFTDDGKGGGRVLNQGLPLVVGDWKKSIWEFVSWNFPDRKEVTRTIDKYFLKTGVLLEKTPRQLCDYYNHVEELSEMAKECYMLKILGPTHNKIGEITWRLKTSRAALLTVIEVLRYRKDKGQYPTNLKDLVTAGYLRKLPADPYSSESLSYKKTDDNFLLYSFGENLKDDGGEIVRDDKGKIKMFANEGDWVFWPVQD